MDALSYSEREKSWHDILTGHGAFQSLEYVAETDGGEIFGFISGGAERSGDPDYQGEVYALYLLQSAQKQGIGRRLVQTLARRLSEEEHRTLLIWVNAQNPACRFYEALGGVAARTGQREIKGITYDDIGYGWDEDALRRLISK